MGEKPQAVRVAESPGSAATTALFAVLAFVWGLNFIFVNVGLEYWPPLWLAMLRAAIGAAGSAVLFAFVRPGRSLDRRGRRDAFLLGLPNTAAFFALWITAAKSVLPGVTAVAVYTYPLWVALLSAPVLGHRLSARQWVSVVVGFSGVVLVSQLEAKGGSMVPPVALAELLVAAVAWGIGTVTFQRRFHREEMLEANVLQLCGGTVGLVLVTFLFEPSFPPTGPPVVWAALLWLGLAGTAVAYSIWYYLLGRTRAATLSAYLFIVPVVALVVSAIVFDERLSVVQLVGVALVLASIFGIARAPGASDPPRMPTGRTAD